MKRKKKKKHGQSKQESRHQRNEFYKKMKLVMSTMGDVSAFELLDKRALDMLYYCRVRPYKIVNPTEDKRKISRNNLRLLNQNLSDLLHHAVVELGTKKIRMSVYDLSVYGETLFLCWRNIADNAPAIADEFKSSFPVFDEKEFQDDRVEAVVAVKQRLEALAWLHSDFTNSVISFAPPKYEKASSPYDNSAFFNNYIVEQQRAETELLKIDGHNRTIFRVFINTEQQIIPLTITPERLGIEGVMQKFPLKVFIQKHALLRIAERLGQRFRQLSYFYIIPAILCESIPAEGKNSYLFPVCLGAIKLGYLKGDVIGDKLVIRTFLFITNNGTPEGKKLHDLVGLQKVDKEYLGIDKLRTFILSDIKKNEQLRNLFCQAGCGDLFNLDSSLLNEPEKKQLTNAGQLMYYLGMEQKSDVKEVSEASLG